MKTIFGCLAALFFMSSAYAQSSDVALIAAAESGDTARVQAFSSSTWRQLVRAITRPTAVVFTTTDCAHCPGAIAQLRRVAGAQADVAAVVMDVGPSALQTLMAAGEQAHYAGLDALWAFDGDAPTLRHGVNPSWRGVTPYVALLRPGAVPLWVMGVPSVREIQQGLAAVPTRVRSTHSGDAASQDDSPIRPLAPAPSKPGALKAGPSAAPRVGQEPQVVRQAGEARPKVSGSPSASAAPSNEAAGLGMVRVTEAWVRSTVAGQRVAGAYFTIAAKGDSKLLGGSTDVAQGVELHEMSMAGDTMRMRELDAMALPAGQAVRLMPGGLHLMLTGIKRPLLVGETLTISLRVKPAKGAEQTIPVRFAVRQQ